MRQLILAVDRVVGRLILALACITLAVAALCGAFQIITRFVLEEPSTC
jgi:TRAP-type C4-dicarboxylate transport system permease small subunit